MTYVTSFRAKAAPTPAEQAVLVYLKLSNDDMGGPEEEAAIYSLEDGLRQIVEGNCLGEFDGDEIGGGYWKLFLYGPNADRITEAVLPLVLRYPARPDSYLVKCYGGPGATQTVINLRIRSSAKRISERLGPN